MTAKAQAQKNKYRLLVLVGIVALGIVAFLVLRPTATQNSTPSTADTSELVTLSGSVTRGPLTPVCQDSTPCYQPMADRTIEAVKDDGSVAGTTKTDSSGKYTFQLKPGHYTVQLTPVADVYRLTNNQIDLSSSNNQLNLIIDTGIR